MQIVGTPRMAEGAKHPYGLERKPLLRGEVTLHRLREITSQKNRTGYRKVAAPLSDYLGRGWYLLLDNFKNSSNFSALLNPVEHS